MGQRLFLVEHDFVILDAAGGGIGLVGTDADAERPLVPVGDGIFHFQLVILHLQPGVSQDPGESGLYCDVQ